MRAKIPASVLIGLAFLIPAAPAVAQTGATSVNEACQTAEHKVYKDIRKLLTIDLDTATDTEVRVLANQIMAAVKDDQLPVLAPALQERLDGTAEDLRAFLKTKALKAWTVDLRISVGRTLTNAGTNVKAAAQKVLSTGTIDTYLAYLNDGLYAARKLDCAAQPSPTPSATATPSATPSAPTTTAPTPTPPATPGTPGGEDGGEGGGLPVTGANTGIVAGIGGALLLLGGGGYLIGRRRRSRFVA